MSPAVSDLKHAGKDAETIRVEGCRKRKRRLVFVFVLCRLGFMLTCVVLVKGAVHANMYRMAEGMDTKG